MTLNKINSGQYVRNVSVLRFERETFLKSGDCFFIGALTNQGMGESNVNIERLWVHISHLLESVDCLVVFAETLFSFAHAHQQVRQIKIIELFLPRNCQGSFASGFPLAVTTGFDVSQSQLVMGEKVIRFDTYRFTELGDGFIVAMGLEKSRPAIKMRLRRIGIFALFGL